MKKREVKRVFTRDQTTEGDSEHHGGSLCMTRGVHGSVAPRAWMCPLLINNKGRQRKLLRQKPLVAGQKPLSFPQHFALSLQEGAH